MHIWELWYPQAASRGLYFARGWMEPTDEVIVHALPDPIAVRVTTAIEGALVAQATSLPATADTPMARLHISGKAITREDIWPNESDIGQPVILPGGEVGLLISWWNAADRSEWRWQIEFYNHR